MPAIDQYSANNTLLRLLLQGPPGAGKSVVACQFPAAHVIDLDVNLGGPLRYLRKHNLKLPVAADRVDIDDAGKPVPIAAQYTRFVQLFNKAEADPNVKSIIIDSATKLTDILMAETERLQPGVKDGRQLFGFFLKYGKEFMARLTSCRKHLVLIAHERIEKNELDQTIKWRVNWPGQMGDYIGAFFTDVWRCEVVAEGFPEKHKWIIRTLPNSRLDLKNSFEFPATFEFKWETIEAQLN